MHAQPWKKCRNPFTIPSHFDRETRVIMKWRLKYRALIPLQIDHQQIGAEATAEDDFL